MVVTDCKTLMGVLPFEPYVAWRLSTGIDICRYRLVFMHLQRSRCTQYQARCSQARASMTTDLCCMWRIKSHNSWNSIPQKLLITFLLLLLLLSITQRTKMIFLSTLITLAFSVSSGSAFPTATVPSKSTSYREYLSKLEPVKAELEAVKKTKQRSSRSRSRETHLDLLKGM